MVTLSYQPPLTVKIPVPSDIPRARGAHGTYANASNIKVRISLIEKAIIEHEAQRLGVSVASFIRWAASHTARQLKEHRNDHRVDGDFP